MSFNKDQNISNQNYSYSKKSSSSFKNINSIDKIIEMQKIDDSNSFIMTINLDENNLQNIKIFYDSNPYEIAFEFCKKYNLNFETLNLLTTEIHKLIDYKKSEKKDDKIEESINCNEINQIESGEDIIGIEEESHSTALNNKSIYEINNISISNNNQINNDLENKGECKIPIENKDSNLNYNYSKGNEISKNPQLSYKLLQKNKERNRLLSWNENKVTIFDKLYKDANNRKSILNKNIENTVDLSRINCDKLTPKKHLGNGENIHSIGLKSKEVNESNLRIKKETGKVIKINKNMTSRQMTESKGIHEVKRVYFIL